MEEPGRLQSMGSLRVGHDWATSLSLFTFMHWRWKWQPLQGSCLENPRDGGAWWAAVYGVTQSRTRLKWLSSSSSHVTIHDNSETEIIVSATKYHCRTQIRQHIRLNDMEIWQQIRLNDMEMIWMIWPSLTPQDPNSFKWFSWMGKTQSIFQQIENPTK